MKNTTINENPCIKWWKDFDYNTQEYLKKKYNRLVVGDYNDPKTIEEIDAIYTLEQDKGRDFKHNLTHYESLINEGSIVRVVDGSYMLSIIANELKQNFEAIKEDNEWKVVAINVDVPTSDSRVNALYYKNNCIIRNTTDGRIAFCSLINIRNKKDFSK